MEARDLKLIEQHKGNNYELNRLWEEHKDLETKIEALSGSRVGLGTEEEKELQNLKKKKLEGRDQLERILETLR